MLLPHAPAYGRVVQDAFVTVGSALVAIAYMLAMRASHDSPLPGDLIIREQEDRSGVRPLSVFVVAVWPQNETSAGPYLSSSYALRQARQLATQRGVHVWREHSPGLQDVSED